MEEAFSGVTSDQTFLRSRDQPAARPSGGEQGEKCESSGASEGRKEGEGPGHVVAGPSRPR